MPRTVFASEASARAPFTAQADGAPAPARWADAHAAPDAPPADAGPSAVPQADGHP